MWGPRERLLLVEEEPSILLYSSLMWAEALADSQRRKQVNTVNWLIGLRIYSVKTISDGAALIVTGMIQWIFWRKKRMGCVM